MPENRPATADELSLAILLLEQARAIVDRLEELSKDDAIKIVRMLSVLYGTSPY